MNLIVIKTRICFILMIAVLIMAFIPKDVINSQVFASLGIITVAFVFKIMSTQHVTTDEKY